MKDCQGNEIQVGDTIVYARESGLCRGKVERSVTEQSFSYTGARRINEYISVVRTGYNGRTTRVTLRTPSNVVRIPA